MYLYKHSGDEVKGFPLKESFHFSIFKPSPFLLQKHMEKSLIHKMWYFFTKGRYKILYIYDGDKIIHYSHVIPGFWKFNFMKRYDLEIGPCWTDPDYRGMGLYPAALSHCVNSFKLKKGAHYMLVDEDNIPSIKGIEKVGFKRIAIVKKRTPLGIYRVKKYL